MISVVLSTYQRGHLLDRSLHCYAHSQIDTPFELVIIDDGSTDDTAQIVEKWSKDLDIVYVKLWKTPGLWRDCAMTLNRGIRAAKGELVVATHPEVMPGKRSLQMLWDARAERTYVACKVYYLTPRDQELLDTVPWRDEGALAVRKIPGFYDEPSPELRGHPDYAHAATDEHCNWESWVFGGMTKETWRWFGGFKESNTWGTIDVDFLTRRRILNIPTDTALDSRSIVVHQNHDVLTRPTDAVTPRDMEACMGNLAVYPTAEAARLGHI